MRIELAVAVLLGLAGPAAAQGLDLAIPVPGHDGVIAFDLMQKLIPDLHLEAAGPAGTVPAFRHVDPEWGEDEPPAALQVGLVDLVPFEADGKQFVAMLAELGQSDMRVGSNGGAGGVR